MIVEKRRGRSTLLTIGNETKPVSQWAKDTGINQRLINERINNGWTEDKLFQQPGSCIPHPFNNHYFDNIDTEDKAYWIGFIWCDGYMAIRKRRGSTSYEFKLSLKDTDYEHLKKFNKCIDGNYSINFYDCSNTFKEAIEARLLITNQHFGKVLVEQYGIVPYRNDCSKILKHIPNHLMKHFIRGVLDADGSFVKYHIIERGYDVTKYSISIGTNEDILRAIEQHLVDNKFAAPCVRKLQKRHKEDDRDGEYRSLNFSGKSQTISILNYIYQDASIYLDRKYYKYLEIVGDVNCNIK